MRALLVAGTLAVVLAGCTRLGTPHAPTVMTAEGRRCVRTCQSLHGRCITRVKREMGESYWNFTSPQVESCNTNLASCYGICPG